MTLAFVVPAELAPTIDAALTPLLRRMRQEGIQAQAGALELAAWAQVVVRGLSLPSGPAGVEDAPMTTTLLLSLPDVAAELACSVSKVKKLVDSGALPTVDFDGVRRVTREDLDGYVQSLRAGRLADRLEVKGHAPAPRPRPGGGCRPHTAEVA